MRYSVIVTIFFGLANYLCAQELLLPFKQNNLYGYFNENQKVIIEPKYNLAAPFYDGLARVRVDESENNEYRLKEKYFFINERGENHFKKIFLLADDFENGYTKVLEPNKKWDNYYHSSKNSSNYFLHKDSSASIQKPPKTYNTKHLVIKKVLKNDTSKLKLSGFEYKDYERCYSFFTKKGEQLNIDSVCTIKELNLKSGQFFLLGYCYECKGPNFLTLIDDEGKVCFSLKKTNQKAGTSYQLDYIDESFYFMLKKYNGISDFTYSMVRFQEDNILSFISEKKDIEVLYNIIEAKIKDTLEYTPYKNIENLVFKEIYNSDVSKNEYFLFNDSSGLAKNIAYKTVEPINDTLYYLTRSDYGIFYNEEFKPQFKFKSFEHQSLYKDITGENFLLINPENGEIVRKEKTGEVRFREKGRNYSNENINLNIMFKGDVSYIIDEDGSDFAIVKDTHLKTITDDTIGVDYKENRYPLLPFVTNKTNRLPFPDLDTTAIKKVYNDVHEAINYDTIAAEKASKYIKETFFDTQKIPDIKSGTNWFKMHRNQKNIFLSVEKLNHPVTEIPYYSLMIEENTKVLLDNQYNWIHSIKHKFNVSYNIYQYNELGYRIDGSSMPLMLAVDKNGNQIINEKRGDFSCLKTDLFHIYKYTPPSQRYNIQSKFIVYDKNNENKLWEKQLGDLRPLISPYFAIRKNRLYYLVDGNSGELVDTQSYITISVNDEKKQLALKTKEDVPIIYLDKDLNSIPKPSEFKYTNYSKIYFNREDSCVYFPYYTNPIFDKTICTKYSFIGVYTDDNNDGIRFFNRKNDEELRSFMRYLYNHTYTKSLKAGETYFLATRNMELGWLTMEEEFMSLEVDYYALIAKLNSLYNNNTYTHINILNENHIAFRTKEYLYGIMDFNENVVLPPIYSSIEKAAGGYNTILKDKKIYLTSDRSKWWIEENFDIDIENKVY